MTCHAWIEPVEEFKRRWPRWVGDVCAGAQR